MPMPPSSARRAAGERRALQVAVALGGLVPVGAGLAGILEGATMTGLAAGPDAALDSHVRYLSGLLLAIGVGFWSTIASIDAAPATARFRLLTAIVVTGGLSRLLGIAIASVPPASMRFGLAMELAVTPALCLWQARIARRSRPLSARSAV